VLRARRIRHLPPSRICTSVYKPSQVRRASLGRCCRSSHSPVSGRGQRQATNWRLMGTTEGQVFGEKNGKIGPAELPRSDSACRREEDAPNAFKAVLKVLDRQVRLGAA
jgi:hypothetical protein